MIVLQGAKERIEVLAFSPDSRMLVAPFSAGVQVWNNPAEGGPPTTVLDQPKFSSACFTPDGQKLLLGGPQVAVHDLPTREGAEVPLELSVPWAYCDLSPDGQYLIAAQVELSRKPPGRLFSRPLSDLTSSIWSIDTNRLIHAPPLFLAGGERFVLLEWRWEPPPVGVARVYVTRDARTGQVLAEVVTTEDDKCYHPVMSADRRLVAGRLGIWAVVYRAEDFGTGPVVVLRNDNRREYTGLAFHPSGRFLAATSNDATVKLYDTATWTLAQAFNWDIGRLRSVAFSPDGMLAAASGDKGKIVLWDMDL
jgi:WD40 repeat protein